MAKSAFPVHPSVASCGELCWIPTVGIFCQLRMSYQKRKLFLFTGHGGKDISHDLCREGKELHRLRTRVSPYFRGSCGHPLSFATERATFTVASRCSPYNRSLIERSSTGTGSKFQYLQPIIDLKGPHFGAFYGCWCTQLFRHSPSGPFQVD